MNRNVGILCAWLVMLAAPPAWSAEQEPIESRLEVDLPLIAGVSALWLTAELTLRRKGDDLLVCLLHYAYQRRGHAAGIDIVEEPQVLSGVELDVRVDASDVTAVLVPDGVELECTVQDGRAHIALPLIRGHAVVALRGACAGRGGH